MSDLLQNNLFLGVPAYAALILSLYLFFRDFRSDRKLLELEVAGIRVWRKDNYYLILFHVLLVNPSHKARTVVRLAVWPPVGIDRSTAQPLIDESLNSVTFRQPNGEMTPAFSKDEVLLNACDILPNQSLNKIVGSYMELNSTGDKFFDNFPQEFVVSAHDIHGKQISHAKPLRLSLQQLKDNDQLVSGQILNLKQ